MLKSKYQRYNKGDIYNISFWSSFAWTFLIAAVIYMFGFILTIAITYPSLIKGVLSIVNNDVLPQELVSSSFVIQVTSGLLPVFLLTYIFQKDIIRNLKELKSKPLYYIGIVIGIWILTYVLIYIVDLIYKKLGIVGSSENQDVIESAIMSPVRPLVFIATVIMAPILEELIFRKALFGMLEHRFKLNKILVLVIGSLFFAGIHVLSPGNLKYIFLYLPVSLTIGFSYLYTGNIFVPITIHFINNLIVYLNVIGVLNV